MTDEKKKEMYKELSERISSAILDESVEIRKKYFDEMTDDDRAIFHANVLVLIESADKIIKIF